MSLSATGKAGVLFGTMPYDTSCISSDQRALVHKSHFEAVLNKILHSF